MRFESLSTFSEKHNQNECLAMLPGCLRSELSPEQSRALLTTANTQSLAICSADRRMLLVPHLS